VSIRQDSAIFLHKEIDFIKARAEAADIDSVVCCHTFRAVAITVYLEADGAIEKAAHYAGDSSTAPRRYTTAARM
jgi:hypothetical protein